MPMQMQCGIKHHENVSISTGPSMNCYCETSTSDLHWAKLRDLHGSTLSTGCDDVVTSAVTMSL